MVSAEQDKRAFSTNRASLDVPFPRTGKGLVEIVEVEYKPPLRPSRTREVRQVSIAAAFGTFSPDRGVAARSWAMIIAAPR